MSLADSNFLQVVPSVFSEVSHSVSYLSRLSARDYSRVSTTSSWSSMEEDSASFSSGPDHPATFVLKAVMGSAFIRSAIFPMEPRFLVDTYDPKQSMFMVLSDPYLAGAQFSSFGSAASPVIPVLGESR